MNIIIRQSVKKELANNLHSILQKSLEWMQRKYPEINFENTEYIFSAGYNRSRYFRNENGTGKYEMPTVCICTRATLYLYEKKSLGIKKTSLFVGSELQVACALIHELTHHVQYERNVRKGNELDTTSNELEYIKEFSPTHYKKITKTK